ncbi:MAG TPA: hypothetical protein VH598_14495, partial [Verrucomicrobiae bacterium]|nr:hypothetical protein [Verrucomicrobiae bacterium]
VERVYYNHRLGDKPAFEQALPREALEKLVRGDQRKESALRKVYGVEVTPAMLEAEVKRINSTTRAPEILAELKRALGNDPERFARTVARPIIVERLLRERFENDDSLHAKQRGEAERARGELLAAKQAGGDPGKLLLALKHDHGSETSELTWQLGARPEEKAAPGPGDAEIRKRFGPEARILSPPGGGEQRKLYFGELPAELQRVLRVQLREAGDVSAVIETPDAFLVYLATAKTAETLSVAALTIRKRDYEAWLAEQ